MLLSDKYWDFIDTPARADFLEGTTSSGKTTTVAIKFMMEVERSKVTQHVIASKTTGTAEKNIIQCDLGIKSIFPDSEYCGKGDNGNKLPHIKFHNKIIYILGYDDSSKWKNALGSQFGCVWVDEVNTANMEFVREIFGRSEYFVGTLNPDDPTLPIYEEYVNRSRPIEQYEKDVPAEIMEDLMQAAPMLSWHYWFFTFEANVGMTPEKIADKKASYPPGTKIYKNKILGLRGKATGLVFAVFNERVHCISKESAKLFIKDKKHNKEQTEWFEIFTAGLDTAYSSKSPDTIAMSFGGITNKGLYILLEESVYNNKDLVDSPIAPSDTVSNFYAFLERCRKEWGFAKNTFIDSADQATITEFQKYKRMHPECLYVFNGAYKKTTIIDRIILQSGWMSFESRAPKFLICSNCKTYIQELNTYSWDEKKDNTPEDGHDHMINSVQYSWLPYKKKIGER